MGKTKFRLNNTTIIKIWLNITIMHINYNITRKRMLLSFTVQTTGDLESPRKRRRRNSDSILHCKARDVATAQSETEAETKHLDSEKYEFVQSYLQNIQETHSMTTETSDSGIRTHGEPSDLEIQDISGKYNCVHNHNPVCFDLFWDGFVRRFAPPPPPQSQQQEQTTS